MKKLLYSVAGLVAIVLAVILIGPSFINWNNYKAEGAAWLKSLTGRDVAIDGDIKIAILPAPALIVKGVRIANAEGAANPEMARLKSLEVRIALQPLLGGSVQIKTIRLVEPVIEIETFADGRNNLDFSAAAQADKPPQAGNAVPPQPPPEDIRSSEAAPALPKSGVPPKSSGPAPAPVKNGFGVDFDLKLDNFVIVDGVVVYRDANSLGLERIENINATIAAKSMSGPLESSGSMTARGVPLSFNISVGKIAAERAVPFSLKLTDASSGGEATLAGTLLNIAKKIKFKGALKGKGDDLAGLLNTAARTGALPGFLSQPFGFEGEVTASAEGVDIQNLDMRIGDTELKSALSVKMGETLDANLKIGIKRADLNKLLAMPSVKMKAPPRTAAAKSVDELKAPAAPSAAKPGAAKGEIQKAPGGTQGGAPPIINAGGAPAAPAPASGFSIPPGVNGAVSVSIDSLIYLDGVIRETQLSAELANGEITISRLSAKFPGGAETTLFGFITAAKGQPRFEGDMEANVSDLRKFLSWLNVKKLDVPNDRLRKMTLAGKVAATSDNVQFGEMDVKFDSSKLTGGVTVALRARPSFGAKLTLDRINLDAYLAAAAKPAQAAKTKAGEAPKDGGATQKEAKKDKQKTVSPLTVLSVLNSFDANIMAHVQTLVYKGTSIKDAVLDATLFNGALDVRRASVNKLAGASALISGKISNIGGLSEMKDIDIQVRAPDVSRLFKLAGAAPTFDAKKLGTVTLKSLINGSALKPAINVNLNAGGGDFSVNGTLSLLPLVGGFDGALKAKHPNLPKLLQAFGVNFAPKGKFGGLNVSANIRADTKTVSLDGIKGKIGAIAVAGLLKARIDGPRPKITADLQTGEIVIDRLLAAKRTAALHLPGPAFGGKPRIIPASWPGPPPPIGALPFQDARAAAAAKERWSTDPIDLSALRDFDAQIKLKAPAVSYRKYKLENADLAATVNKGVLNFGRLAGNLFGGKFDGAATVYAAATPRAKASFTLGGMNLGRALRAVSGKAMADGGMDMRLNLDTTGRSVDGMISALNGDGSVIMRNVAVNKKAAGTALGLFVVLNQLGGGGNPLANITSTFNIKKGVVRSEDIKLVSKIGNGGAKGDIDLPNWKMDVVGEVSLSQNTLAALIAKKTKAPSALPFKIRGSIDAPNVILDIAKLPGGGVALPGSLGKKLQKNIDKLDKKLKKKGLGGLLEKLAPGLTGAGKTQTQTKTQTQPQSQAPASAEPPPPPPQQPQKPKDALRDLLKGLTR